jgi:hypothetical protein
LYALLNLRQRSEPGPDQSPFDQEQNL